MRVATKIMQKNGSLLIYDSSWDVKDSIERDRELLPLPGFKGGAVARGITGPRSICLKKKKKSCTEVSATDREKAFVILTPFRCLAIKAISVGWYTQVCGWPLYTPYGDTGFVESGKPKIVKIFWFTI